MHPRWPATGRPSSVCIWHCFPVFCLLALCWLLFFHRLGERDLWSSHEARAAQNAQGILDSGDWVLPRLYDQRPELQKPPLYYWLVAGVAWLSGAPVDPWAVRLPAALAAVGCVVAVSWLARSGGRPAVGWIAAGVLATALHFTWLARVGRIDMPLTLTVTLALAGYYRGLGRLREHQGRGAWPWFLMAYLAVAAAVLLKGPIGAILVAAVAGVHLLMEGELLRNRPTGVSLQRHWLRLAHQCGLWWGLLLVAALVVPWFGWVNVQTDGELFRVFFWYHNVERGFGGSGKLATHPWWFYAPRFAADFLPWTPALLIAVWCFWKYPACRQDAQARFGLVWLVTTIALLSCMRFKRADYLLPAYPGAALFLARMTGRGQAKGQSEERAASAFGLWPLAFGLVAVAVAAGWWVYLHHALPGEDQRKGYKDFAATIRRRVPAPRPVILFCTKAHSLTFHLGRPVDTLLEWENLDIWAGRPGTYYVVMPPALVREWPRHLKSGRLVEVLRSTDLAGGQEERPLVLLRTLPSAGPCRTLTRGNHVRANRTERAAADQQGTPQCRSARLE